MTIELIHFNVRQRINKLDTEQYRNLSIPEIDAAINNAVSYIVNGLNYVASYEDNVVRDSLNILTKTQILDDTVRQYNSDTKSTTFTLPEDFRFYRPSQIEASTTQCTGLRKFDLIDLRRSDLNINFKPANTSYRWGIFYCDIVDNKIVIPETESITIQKVILTYIKNPRYAHLAELLNGYRLPDNTFLTGKVEPELPAHLHEQLIQITSLILTQGLNQLDYNLIKDLLSLGSPNTNVQ